MLRSFYSGISGLRNHQQAMDVVGNNISNVNTPGYKGSRVTFMDTLSQTLQGARRATSEQGGRNPLQVGLGMTLAAVDRNMGQGALQATGNNLDLAIEGQGFFVVGQQANFFYTRVGAFSVDDEFNLVTNTGDRVYGWVDTDQSGTVDPSQDLPGFINLDRRGDGRISNVLAASTPPVAGPNLGDGSLGEVVTLATTLTDDWRAQAILRDPSDPSSVAFQVTGEKTGEVGVFDLGDTVSDPRLGSFTVNGGNPNQAILYLDTNGNGESLKVVAKEYGAGGNDISVEFVNRGVNQSLGVAAVGNKITVSLGTDATGAVSSTEAQIAVEIRDRVSQLVEVSVVQKGSTDVDGNGNFEDDTVIVDVDGTELVPPDTQAAGVPTVAQFLRYGAGPNVGDYFTFSTTAPGGASLETLSVSRDGAIIGIFENGTTEEIASVALANVPNPQGLLAMGGGKFAESPTSGTGFPAVTPGAGGTGTVASGFLEMSNVDLTREFTDMIVTQRGFQANSRIITTSDEMLQDLLALKR